MEMMKIVEGRAVLAEKNLVLILVLLEIFLKQKDYLKAQRGLLLLLLSLSLLLLLLLLSFPKLSGGDNHFSLGSKLKTNLRWLNHLFDSKL